MTIKNTNSFSLLNVLGYHDNTGGVSEIGELLSINAPFVEDMPFIEANGIREHEVTLRTSLPATTNRLLGEGIQATSSTTAKSIFQFYNVSTWCEIPADTLSVGGNPDAVRKKEMASHIESVKQDWSANLIYGNRSVNPRLANGLAYHLNSFSNGENKRMVKDAGGTGADNSSIYIINFGEDTIFSAYPKGSSAGLKHEDHGEGIAYQTNDQGKTTMLKVFNSEINWDSGLVVRDWRYAARIANIDVSNLLTNSSAELPELIDQAMDELENLNGARIYINRKCFTALKKQLKEDVKSGGQLDYDTLKNGERIPVYNGLPIRITDSLLYTESAIS